MESYSSNQAEQQALAYERQRGDLSRCLAEIWREHIADLHALSPKPPADDTGAAIAVARECFLNMVADAQKWEVDVDGDVDADGHQTITVTYHLVVDGFSFEQLPEALGIRPKYMETMQDAIEREVNKPAKPLTAHQENPND